MVNFQAHGNGRTLSRFGEGLAGWAEFLQVTGIGLIIGTFGNRPLILDTNSTNVLEITAGGDVLYQGVAVHSDRQAIVEELEKAHIYITQLNERLNEKEAQVEEQDQEIEELSQRLEHLEAAVTGER